MIRVIADSNVYISALNFGGVADEVLALGRQRVIALFISPAMLEEVEGVLVRKFGWSSERARQARRAIRAFVEVVRPKETVEVVHEDPPDNRILECALAAGAQVLVTGDRHLRSLERFRATAILTPREFLEARMWEASFPGSRTGVRPAGFSRPL